MTRALFHPIYTPQESLQPISYTGSAAAAPVKAGKKLAGNASSAASGVSVQLEKDWIAEHARQIARMLPGGAYVPGLGMHTLPLLECVLPFVYPAVLTHSICLTQV